MADTKISQLPAATTPLSGTELVPLVQSGATVQTPISDVTAPCAKLASANTFTGNQTVTGTLVMASSFLRNRIINGDMRIDQRNAGASIANIAGGTYSVDRWSIYGPIATKFTAQQNAGAVAPPAGHKNYLGITSSSAYTVGATEGYAVRQYIEGFNTSDLGFGAAGASSVTLSFWVRSSLTGNFGGCFYNGAVDRFYPFTYSISAANTWEQKTVTIAGDTSGTWIGATNGVGLSVQFSLGAGATASGTAGAWTSSAHVQPTGSVSVVGTNAATFYITGVQLEAGSAATPYERRQYGQELSLCQRYYEKMFIGGSCGAISGAGQTLAFTYNYRVPKRSSVTPVHIPATEGITAFPSGSPVFSVITAEGFLAYKISTAANVNANWYVDVYANAEL